MILFDMLGSGRANGAEGGVSGERSTGVKSDRNCKGVVHRESDRSSGKRKVALVNGVVK